MSNEEPVAAIIFQSGRAEIQQGAQTLAIFVGTEQLRKMINAPIRIEEEAPENVEDSKE